MKPRITISLNKAGELQLWINPAGRDLLVQQLQALDEVHEHFHLGPEDLSEVPVQNIAYQEGDQIFEWGKVLFRQDAWDEQHFPHVLSSVGCSR